MISIKVLGAGCANCKRLEQITTSAIENLAIEAEVVKVTDYQEIMAYDLLATPALVINERVVSSGRIPSVTEITSWLAGAMKSA